MIAIPSNQRTMERHHDIAIREDQSRVKRFAQDTIEKKPVAVLAVATCVGVALGWLVKRHLR